MVISAQHTDLMVHRVWLAGSGTEVEQQTRLTEMSWALDETKQSTNRKPAGPVLLPPQSRGSGKLGACVTHHTAPRVYPSRAQTKACQSSVILKDPGGCGWRYGAPHCQAPLGGRSLCGWWAHHAQLRLQTQDLHHHRDNGKNSVKDDVMLFMDRKWPAGMA